MNFFGGKKNNDDQVTSSMSIEELDKLIEEKKKQINQISDSIGETISEIEKNESAMILMTGARMT